MSSIPQYDQVPGSTPRYDQVPGALSAQYDLPPTDSPSVAAAAAASAASVPALAPSAVSALYDEPPVGGVDGVAPYGRAVFAFEGEYANELSFPADSIVRLVRRIDENWLEGEVDGKVGIFPATFVQIVIDLPRIGTATPLPAQTASSADDTLGGGGQGGDGIGFATVRHSFTASQPDELTVAAGDSVRVMKMVNAEWVSCRDPVSEQTGIVPIGFLELYLDEDEEEGGGGQRRSRPTSFVEGGGGGGAGGLAAAFATLGGPKETAQPSIYPSLTSAADREVELSRQPPAWASFNTPTSPQSGAAGAGGAADPFGAGAFSSSSFSSSTASAAFGASAFGDDWTSSAAAAAPASKPSRPPPPKVTSPRDEVTINEMFKSSSNQQIAPTGSQADQRAKVLEDLISSEYEFITDLKAYETAVKESTQLSTKQKEVIVNGIPEIASLSKLLADALRVEQTLIPDEQAVGLVFLNLQKTFAQTYGYYFRNIEHIYAMIENKTDSTLEESLKGVVTRMRALGSNAFDVPTAVGRPVHRCLKYPLFIGELIKHTPINHSDHPKLLEALKQMINLGAKMNESKRRKELARKYSEDQNTSLGQKLSKINMHSLVKKTNRFKYRMGSSLGIIQLTKDPEFDSLVCDLDACERRVVRFNYHLVIYLKEMVAQLRSKFDDKFAPKKGSGPSTQNTSEQLSTNNYDKLSSRLNQMCEEFAIQLRTKVRDECIKAVRVIPKKLIQKRNDKLMDYEAAKGSVKNSSELSNRYKDFEALNTQVKNTLPKVIDVLNSVLRNAMQNVEEMDADLVLRAHNKFEGESSTAAKLGFKPGSPSFTTRLNKERLYELQLIVRKADLDRSKSSGAGRRKKVELTGRKKSKNTAIEYGVDAASALDMGSSASRSSQHDSSSSASVPAASLFPTADFGATASAAAASPASPAQSISSMALPAAMPPPQSSNNGTTFRAQTAAERVVLLQKAEQKQRRGDVYRVQTEWPSSKEARETSSRSGRMLICNVGDAVLAVKREQMGLWYCYNGFYNGLLPSGILKPYFSDPVSGSSRAFDAFTVAGGGASASFSSASAAAPPLPAASIMRPQSTPIKETTNLIDFDDSPIDSVPVLQPQSLRPAANSVPWGSSVSQRAPSLPDLVQQPVFSTNDAFAVRVQAVPAGTSGLPPRPQQTAKARDDAFAMLWDEVSKTSVANRSDSPQPLVPLRPTPMQTQTAALSSSAFPPSSMSGGPPDYSALADIDSIQTSVFTNGGTFTARSNTSATSSSNPFGDGGVVPMNVLSAYSQPPADPFLVPATVRNTLQPIQTNQQQSVQQASPVSPSVNKNGLYDVVAEFEFSPVGANQLAISEGEVLRMLQPHDDEGNGDWVLVRRLEGGSSAAAGYVPGAYVKKC